MFKIIIKKALESSVENPDPQDPHIFAHPGSGSFIQRYGFGSGSGSFLFLFLIIKV
jgi:hypothetical protein